MFHVKHSCGEYRHGFPVNRRPVEFGHCGWHEPADIRMLGQPWGAGSQMADERGEAYGAEIIVVLTGAHLIRDVDFAQQFLFDFAVQCLACGFVSLDFAAGKLPIAAQRFAGATLGA